MSYMLKQRAEKLKTQVKLLAEDCVKNWRTNHLRAKLTDVRYESNVPASPHRQFEEEALFGSERLGYLGRIRCTHPTPVRSAWGRIIDCCPRGLLLSHVG